MRRRGSWQGSVTTIGAILLFLLLAGFSVHQMYTGNGARDELLERYRSAEITEFHPFSFRCTLGKNRLDYSFKAVDSKGRQVTGYVCYTAFSLMPTNIHETGVSS